MADDEHVRLPYVVARDAWWQPLDTPDSEPATASTDWEPGQPLPPGWPGPWTIEMTLRSVSLEVMALLTNIPLVDLSIDWDTHIIRGEN